ncbi:MAG: nitrate reductase molybdenum cofactor assembly chaperone [Halioglobus sp.]|nr:nitrate reductase molybdenum cofactor assembly chaperone [Halioglobus sp.]
MRILKIISRLLDYPQQELLTYRADLALEIGDSREISPEMRLRLLDVLGALSGGDLMDAQENYGMLFDQGRSVSLHLFEHVHGESRDRGQAMVDLMTVYRNNGFEMDALELPDYLPLFLEYLSNRPDLEVREWLADVSHIIARVAARLEERGEVGASYAVLLESLLMIAGQQDQLATLRGTLADEQPDNTPEAIDQEWEETAVTFGAPDKNCGLDKKPQESQTTALHWVDASAQSRGYVA